MTRRKHHSMILEYAFAFLWICILVCLVFLNAAKKTGASQVPLINPSLDSSIFEYPQTLQIFGTGENPAKELTVDELVGKYADLFGETVDQKSKLRATLHCLLYKESKHWAVKGHGDGGLAGGPLQFHEATWKAFRKAMGLETGSRYNLDQAIETTAWALSTGRGKNWGPILRGECK